MDEARTHKRRIVTWRGLGAAFLLVLGLVTATPTASADFQKCGVEFQPQTVTVHHGGCVHNAEHGARNTWNNTANTVNDQCGWLFDNPELPLDCPITMRPLPREIQKPEPMVQD